MNAIVNAYVATLRETTKTTEKKLTLIAAAMTQAGNLAQHMQQGAMRNVLRSIEQGATGTNAPECMGHILKMGAPIWAEFDALIPADFAQNANQKAIMRTLEGFEFIATSGNSAERQSGYQQITAAIIAALMLTTETRVTFEALRHTVGERGIINPDTIPGVSQYKLRTLLKNCTKNKKGESLTKDTISSMVSRTVGVHGLLGAMGITSKVSGDSFEVNPNARNHVFMIAYCKGLSIMSDSDLGLIAE